ncbi:hypothetical protein [Agreia pratensis]|uniref:Uncharacterized protein n=1 Tax=Agreia pratensis TaxID=150121 RepID=A0A1X7IU00_9MICO|nr:hypothetical protein [Agreia pratensis]SMG18344.1 hypothetical protein SAMN06296010_0857 [Agreia pratensis]
MSEQLRYPSPEDEQDLELHFEDFALYKTLFDGAHEHFRAVARQKAIRAEKLYIPWFDAIEEIVNRGKAIDLLSDTPEVDGVTSSKTDCWEYLGWMDLAKEDQSSAAKKMTELFTEPVPGRPFHWPTSDVTSNHADDDSTSVFGNVTLHNSPLTALAMTILLPHIVEPALQAELMNSSYDRLAVAEPWVTVSRWIDVVDLSPAMQIIVGLLSARRAAPVEPKVDDHRKAAFFIDSLILRIDTNPEHFTMLALKDELLKRARQDDVAIAVAVPWFLALDSTAHHNLLLTMAMENSAVLHAATLYGEGGSDLALRARGLALAASPHSTASAMSTFMWWLDQRYYLTPQPLASPTSTWLGDATLEKEIRDKISGCLERLSTAGLSEETEVTGAIVNALATAFHDDSLLPQSQAGTPPVRLSVTSTNSSTHEKLSGADLGIVVDINLPGRQKVRTGHLVQVKQAGNREDPQAAPSWKIDVEQLKLILTMDPGATYWLIQLHRAPKVISVPAKVLLGVCVSRNNEKVATATYDQIRSASVGVGTELLDLLLGLWLGDAGQEAVERASGLNSRHAPAIVLTLSLTDAG